MWLAVRNVVSVDGRTVPDSKERLDKILAAGGIDYIPKLWRIHAESARYDIGQVWRTTGSPILVLRFVSPFYQPRFTYELDGHERIGGERVAAVAFVEQGRPTAIKFNDSDMPSSGTVWIRSVDGTVVKTNLRVTTPTRMEVSITTEFRLDPKLALRVPWRLEERYVEITGESTTATARYSNSRRFETSGRVINRELR